MDELTLEERVERLETMVYALIGHVISVDKNLILSGVMGRPDSPDVINLQKAIEGLEQIFALKRLLGE